VAATFQPSEEHAITVARPMPEEAPDIRTTGKFTTKGFKTLPELGCKSPFHNVSAKGHAVGRGRAMVVDLR
jgi:hypothetical protein